MKERNRLETSENRIFIATGLLKCGECGGSLVGSSAHGAAKVHRYYVHSQRRGDVAKCSYKRLSADEIETAIVEKLSEILMQAGHFEEIGSTIRKSVAVKPEEIKRQRAHFKQELEKVSLGIQRTFKIQAEMDADSDGIRLVAQELQELGRKKKIYANKLEELKATENQANDVDDAVVDLKERLEAFKRGWKKSSPMMKKSLLNDLIWGVVVTDKGLSIEFRLKHGLNSNGFLSAHSTSPKVAGSVIDLSAHRPSNSSPADASADFHNVEIQKLQVVKNGSPLPTTCNFYYQHEFIELFKNSPACIFDVCAPLYRQGHSLSEISALTGFPYTTIRKHLIEGGLTLRPKKAVSTAEVLRQGFKSSSQPPYGYCYLDGRLQKDPREYPILQIIKQQRQLGRSPTAIAKYLNGRNLKPRKGGIWKQPTVFYIVQRLAEMAADQKNKREK